METLIDRAGGRLRTLPTGEVRRYELYIQPIIEDLVAQGVLEVRRPGVWRTSRSRPLHRVRRGVELNGTAMDLGYLHEAEQAAPLFERLRAERELSGVTLQLGMPTPFTMAFIALGPAGVPRYRSAFAAATVREIAGIRALLGDGVVIQLEATAELVLSALTQPLHRAAEAALELGRGIADLAAASPPGTRFGVHLCLGSMGNKARTAMRTAQPLVDLANSVARHWPSDRPLEYVHGPLAAGDIPPPRRAGFYAPLGELSLGPETAFYAGFVHDEPSSAQQVQTLRMIECALGARVGGVASACGLGRRPRAVAEAMVTRAAELAAD
ncbi:hypothetical protein [Nocardia panacis]|nr:hypothetical protein [Nocardia panacis]